MVVQVKDLIGMGAGAVTNEVWTKYITKHAGQSKDLVNGITAISALFGAYYISESRSTGFGYNFLRDFLVGFGLAEIKELTGALLK